MNKPLSLLLTSTALFSTQLLADSNKQEIVNPIQAQVISWINIQVAPKIAFVKRWPSTVGSIVHSFL